MYSEITKCAVPLTVLHIGKVHIQWDENKDQPSVFDIRG